MAGRQHQIVLPLEALSAGLKVSQEVSGGPPDIIGLRTLPESRGLDLALAVLYLPHPRDNGNEE